MGQLSGGRVNVHKGGSGPLGHVLLLVMLGKSVSCCVPFALSRYPKHSAPLLPLQQLLCGGTLEFRFCETVHIYGYVSIVETSERRRYS